MDRDSAGAIIERAAKLGVEEFLKHEGDTLERRGLTIPAELPTVEELMCALIKVPEEDVDLKVSIIWNQDNLKPHVVKLGLSIIGVKDGCYLLIGSEGKHNK